MLFNEALSQATGTKDTVFIPIGWCTDMAGANMNGLERVYGKEVLERVKSCEFHFKENRKKMAQKIKDNEEAQQFKELCDALLAARMVETYCSAKDSLESFIQNKPERSFLSSWVDWWHSRRQFIFRAFSPNEAAPRMNQAEVIHASWSHRDRSNLSLLDAAQADVRDSVMLEAELKAFKCSPNNLVIRHFDRRFIRRDESTGQPVFSVDFKNTYYHLDVSHVRRKNPYFDGKVTVFIEQYHSFESAQNARISSSSGFQIMLT